MEACPGAGKTRALVARFLERPNDRGLGVALLSFTNSAVSEARHRCGTRPEYLVAPNYIGTFDSFVWRYIVVLGFARTNGFGPNYFKSWRQIANPDVMISISNREGIGLWNFVCQGPEEPFTLGDNLSPSDHSYLNSVKRQSNYLERLGEEARRRTQKLNDDGIFDASSARFYARTVLDSEYGQVLLARFKRRFQEFVVDEAQDCDDSEHSILEKLGNVGIPTVVVADLDQSIYGFRGARPDLFATYSASLEPSQRIAFSTNYRSTPAICSLVTSLRYSEAPILALEHDQPSDCDEIFILKGDVSKQCLKYSELLRDWKIKTQDSAVLAYKWSDAARTAGAARSGGSGMAKTDRVIEAVSRLSDRNRYIADRVEAITEVERIVLLALDWPSLLRTTSTAVQLQTIGKNPEWLRLLAARIVRLANGEANADQFGQQLRSFLSSELDNLSVPTVRISANFRKPADELWTRLKDHDREQVDSLPYQTVHSAKGGEWPSVLLVVAPDNRANEGLDSWEGMQDHESRRVLYVGASRAKRLLALATCHAKSAQVESILKRDSVPFTLIEC